PGLPHPWWRDHRHGHRQHGAEPAGQRSFENSGGSWDRIIPSGATTNITRYDNAADAHDGSWYLAFNTSGAGGAGYQDVPVDAPAGASYTATAWLSSQSGTATGRLCLWG